MSIFQLLMLGASAFFAFKIYEHIQTLQEPEESNNNNYEPSGEIEEKTAETFSPFSSNELIQKADDAFEDGENQKALALLNEANVKDENNEEILFKIAYILQKSGDNEESLKYYKIALSLDKKNEMIHNAMASLYRANGEFTSAKIHLKASLDIDDSNPITYYNYGNLCVEVQNNEEAIEMYKKALELDPDFKEAGEELDKLQ